MTVEGKEHLATVADDVVTIAEDGVQLAEDLLRATRHRYILAGGVGLVALGVGFYIGYRVATKKATLRYEVLLEAELAKAREVYAKKYKADEFSTPDQAMATLHGAEAAIQTYQASKDVPADAELIPSDPRPPVETVVGNVFADAEWNQTQEESKRVANPDEPYIISQEEYMEGLPDHQQITLAFYEGDEILCDAQDKPIDAVDRIVGESNLLRFGHGSGDSRVVYVRNDREGADFEIIKSQGSYEQEVLGLKHSSDRRPPRRMRATDD